MFRQISLGTVGLVVGGILTVVGFAAYFADNATLNLAGFFYGIPILLGGLALKASELRPVPFTTPSSPEVIALRAQQATATQNQLRRDVTRYRYGQRIHLEAALESLALIPSDEDFPVLMGIAERAIAQSYALVLEFESPEVPLPVWQEKRGKIERFFGPGVRAEVEGLDRHRIQLSLIAASEATGTA